jgi:DNA-binding transcriptional LysR family regulator
MSSPRVSLDQWRALLAVVEAGGYAQAAEHLHKSQSSVSYAVQRLEQLLRVKVFEIQGRKAVLTPAGQILYRRGRTLVDEAARLERAAGNLSAGWEAELRLAVEIIFPTWLLLQCLGRFGEEHPQTRIELYESVLGGTDELLLQGQVDLAIGSRVPPGFLGNALMPVRFVCAAAPSHPLHQLGRPLTEDDLRRHRHLLIRDTGTRRTRRVGTLEAEQRWTVSNKATSIRAACMGMGYAWYARDSIREELESGKLVPLPLEAGAQRHTMMYLMYADRDAAGPGARRLAEIMREEVGRRSQKRHLIPPAMTFEPPSTPPNSP